MSSSSVRPAVRNLWRDTGDIAPLKFNTTGKTSTAPTVRPLVSSATHSLTSTVSYLTSLLVYLELIMSVVTDSDFKHQGRLALAIDSYEVRLFDSTSCSESRL